MYSGDLSPVSSAATTDKRLFQVGVGLGGLKCFTSVQVIKNHKVENIGADVWRPIKLRRVYVSY